MTLACTNHTNKTEASARIKEARFCSLERHKSSCICIHDNKWFISPCPCWSTLSYIFWYKSLLVLS